MSTHDMKYMAITIDPEKINTDLIGYIGLVEVEESGRFKHAYEVLVTSISKGEAAAAGVRAVVRKSVHGVDPAGRAAVADLFDAVRRGDSNRAKLLGRTLFEIYNTAGSHCFVAIVDGDGQLLERAPRQIGGDGIDIFSARKLFRNSVARMAEQGAYIITHPED